MLICIASCPSPSACPCTTCKAVCSSAYLGLVRAAITILDWISLQTADLVCRSEQSETAHKLFTCHVQNFSGSGYSGLVYDAPEELRDYSVKGKWRIPINMHIGNMGLSPVVGAPIITAPPMRSGGNIDNKRIGIGGKLALITHNLRKAASAVTLLFTAEYYKVVYV